MRLPIRSKMFLFIGLPAVLIYVGTLVGVLKFAHKQAVKSTEEEMLKRTAIAAARFDDYFSKAARMADLTARFLARAPNLSESQLYGIVRDNVRLNKRVFGACIAFEPGSYKEKKGLFAPYAFETRATTGPKVKTMNINEDVYDWYNDPQWEWWHLPKNEGKGIWTAPYFDEGAGNILMTTYSTPFFQDQEEFRGVTTVDIDLSTLEDDIGREIVGGHDFVIVDQDGRFVFSRVREEMLSGNIFDLLDKEGRSDLTGITKEVLAGRSDVNVIKGTSHFEGETVLASYSPLPSTGWSIILFVPETEAYGDFRQRMSIVVGAFGGGLLLILGSIFLTSKKLGQPIADFEEGVLAIAEGKESDTINMIKTGDELEELAGAFCVMQKKVSDREEKLKRARESTLTELLESAPDAMLIADSEGRICRFNHQVLEMFGYEREEAGELHVEQLMPERFRKGHGKHLAAYFADPKARQMGAGLELLGRRKDGSEFPIEIGLSPFHEPDCVMAIAAIRDITERKAAESELRKLMQAVEQSSTMVFITDLEGEIEYVNPQFTEVTRYEASEAIGENPRLLKSGHHSTEFYKDVWDTLIDGRVWRGEFCNTRKDGSLFWAASVLSPLRDNDGKVTHFVAIEDDISDQKEAQEKLERQEERFRTLLANLPETVYRCMHDADWTMEFMSEDALELTGYPASDFLNNEVRTFDSVIHEEDRTMVARKVEEAVQAKGPWTIEYRIARADGAVRWVGERGRAAYRDDGSVICLDGVIADITERKEMEAQIRTAREEADAANQAKSEFLSHMSHELRTPLNGVLGYAQILQRDPDVTHKQKGSLDAIVNCGDHLLALINDVLDLSKIEAGKLDIDLAPTNLPKLIQGVSDIVQQRAAARNLTFESVVSPEVPKAIVTDGAKLRQILVNLLGNAVKFTNEGGVTLRVVESPKGRLRFEIIDTGVGMTEEELDHIFDPFKQVEGGKAAGGTGLGLSITKRLAEKLSGEVTVKSRKDEGSTFIVSVPMEEAEVEDLETFESEGLLSYGDVKLAAGEEATVLVTDDRETNRDILKNMLETMGIRVQLADDGDTALESLRRERPNLVLLDVRMPRMNGIDAVKEIRADDSLKDLRVIAVTASVFPEFREKAIEAGFDDFLGKPFRTEELVQKLKKYLDVEFEEVETAEAAPAEAADAPVDASGVSPELLEKLRAALTIKNLTSINAVAKEIAESETTKAFGDEVKKRASAFDFAGLDALVKEAGS